MKTKAFGALFGAKNSVSIFKAFSRHHLIKARQDSALKTLIKTLNQKNYIARY